MKRKQKKIDPIPEQFATYEEAAEFWDTHDTTDFPEAFSDVDVEFDIKGRRFEIDIDEDVVQLLKEKASRSKIPIGRLASRLLRRDLTGVDA